MSSRLPHQSKLYYSFQSCSCTIPELQSILIATFKGYVWDVHNPNTPDMELLPPSPLCCLRFNPKSTDTLVGGSYNGLITFYDLVRASNQSAYVMSSMYSITSSYSYGTTTATATATATATTAAITTATSVEEAEGRPRTSPLSHLQSSKSPITTQSMKYGG